MAIKYTKPAAVEETSRLHLGVSIVEHDLTGNIEASAVLFDGHNQVVTRREISKLPEFIKNYFESIKTELKNEVKAVEIKE